MRWKRRMKNWRGSTQRRRLVHSRLRAARPTRSRVICDCKAASAHAVIAARTRGARKPLAPCTISRRSSTIAHQLRQAARRRHPRRVFSASSSMRRDAQSSLAQAAQAFNARRTCSFNNDANGRRITSRRRAASTDASRHVYTQRSRVRCLSDATTCRMLDSKCAVDVQELNARR